MNEKRFEVVQNSGNLLSETLKDPCLSYIKQLSTSVFDWKLNGVALTPLQGLQLRIDLYSV